MDFFLAIVGLLTIILLLNRFGLLGSVKDVEAARALVADPKYEWSDVLKASGGEIRFDPRGDGHLLALPRGGTPEVVRFGDVREWGYDPLMNIVKDRQLGFRFKIATSNPRRPIIFIDIRGRNQSVPEYWAAKVSAYIW